MAICDPGGGAQRLKEEKTEKKEQVVLVWRRRSAELCHGLGRPSRGVVKDFELPELAVAALPVATETEKNRKTKKKQGPSRRRGSSAAEVTAPEGWCQG